MKDFDRSSAQSNWPELTTASTVNLINCDRNITATCNKITDSVLYLNIVHSPPKIRQVSFQLQIIRFSEFTSGSYTADGNHSIESPRLLYAYLPHTHTVWESFSVYCHFARPEKKILFFVANRSLRRLFYYFSNVKNYSVLRIYFHDFE